MNSLTQLSAINQLIVLMLTSLGFYYYIKIANQEKSNKIGEFFMAGRNIGVPLFTHASWGTSNGFGNSIFYAVWLGYTVGLAGIWIQFFWCLGIIIYAIWFLPKLIKHSGKYTLHGYLGFLFGKKTRIIASTVSLVGLFVCIGFEISFSAGFFSQILGIGALRIPVILVFGIFIATFCSIGGFKANAKTDKISNILATIGIILLIVLLLPSYLNSNSSNFITHFDSFFSIPKSNSNVFYIGIFFFGAYQFIDMTNWQTISANSLEDNAPAKKKMKLALIKSAIYITSSPIITGTILGYMLKTLQSGITNQDTIMSSLVIGALPQNQFFSIIILSFITFGFMASSLSATDSWLLASAQTVSWDMLDYRIFNKFHFKVSDMDQNTNEKITQRARTILMILGISSSIVIYIISLYWSDVFNLQFVMFGAGLSMIPSLMFGLKLFRYSNNILSWTAFLSISLGLLSSIVCFVISIKTKDYDWVYYIPPLTLSISFFVFIIGFILYFFNKQISNNHAQI